LDLYLIDSRHILQDGFERNTRGITGYSIKKKDKKKISVDAEINSA
jgi:hypothetical protein